MIYVKEHPRQFDNSTPDLRKVHSRIPDFYTKIKKLSRVKLINIDYNSTELINNASIVATITGSSGWQALKTGKPIFIFGYPWYSSCFGAFVIKNSNDIVNSFKEIKKLNNYIQCLTQQYKHVKKWAKIGSHLPSCGKIHDK